MNNGFGISKENLGNYYYEGNKIAIDYERVLLAISGST